MPTKNWIQRTTSDPRALNIGHQPFECNASHLSKGALTWVGYFEPVSPDVN